MKIKLDRTKCDGFGTCALYAPDVFSLDEWGYASLETRGEILPEREGDVRRAVLDCPVHAIIELQVQSETVRSFSVPKEAQQHQRTIEKETIREHS
ncbi:ferredoxin [Microbacterium sp. P5_E9]